MQQHFGIATVRAADEQKDIWICVADAVEGVVARIREGDVRHSMADTTLAVAELGHAPRFTIEEGLKRTLAWYRTQAAKTPAA